MDKKKHVFFLSFFQKSWAKPQAIFLLLKHVITKGHYRMAKKFLSLFSSPIKKEKSAAPSNTFHSLAPLLLAGFCFHFLFYKIEQSQQHLIQLNKKTFCQHFKRDFSLSFLFFFFTRKEPWQVSRAPKNQMVFVSQFGPLVQKGPKMVYRDPKLIQ